MKKNVWVFGTIAGLICSSWYIALMVGGFRDLNFDMAEIVGYSTMIVAFSLIFVAVKNYRDKFNNGVVSFGKAFRIGLYISLVAGTIYCLIWTLTSYSAMPDFLDSYNRKVLEKMQAEGATQAAIASKAAEMKEFAELYDNPVIRFFFTYVEILPVGLLVSLIAAFVLRKKPDSATAIAR